MRTDNPNIWVVGAKGMLGHEVTDILDEKRIQYLATDIDCDITDLSVLESYISGKEFTHIINCAAYTAVDQAEDDEDQAFLLNAVGPKNLALAAKKNNIILIHVSTDYVFDGKNPKGYNPNDPVNPISAYGRTKASGEKFIQEILDKFYIVRTSWLYGKYGKNFVVTMLNLMNERDTISVVNDQHGAPTYAVDLAKYLISLVFLDINFGIYHFTNIGEITWYDFACSIYDLGEAIGLIHNKCSIIPISSSDFNSKASRPIYSYLLNEKNNGKKWSYSLKKMLQSL